MRWTAWPASNLSARVPALAPIRSFQTNTIIIHDEGDLRYRRQFIPLLVRRFFLLHTYSLHFYLSSIRCRALAYIVAKPP